MQNGLANLLRADATSVMECVVDVAALIETLDVIGMSPITIARAFDPFFTTKGDGLGGVGLPMVERFVREAGGRISIESQLEVGTTVTMRLPAIARSTEPGVAVEMGTTREESD